MKLKSWRVHEQVGGEPAWRRFLVVGSAATQVRDLAWLEQHIPADAACHVTDLTSAYTVFGLAGPRSRALLAALTGRDLGNAEFPFRASQLLDLGYARIRANRISYTGELGWELFVPTEFAAHVYDVIWEAGKDYSLAHCGFHALNSLRMEKGFVHWGHDVTTDEDPYQAGLGFAVAMDKVGGFIGRDALARRLGTGARRQVVFVRMLEDELAFHGREPILQAGSCVGEITSGAYGFTVGAPTGVGYLEPGTLPSDPNTPSDTDLHVLVASRLIPAEVSTRPFYDPSGQRLRG